MAANSLESNQLPNVRSIEFARKIASNSNDRLWHTVAGKQCEVSLGFAAVARDSHLANLDYYRSLVVNRKPSCYLVHTE